MSRRYRRRNPRDGEFAVPIQQRQGPPPGPEVLPWYWHPGRDGAQPAPSAFDKRLKEICPDLAVVFSPVHERWMVWVKNPRIQHELCRGWQLLFLWEHPQTHEFLPLNELVFHNLMLIDSSKYAGAKDYFDKVQKSIDDARKEREKTYQNERRASQREFTKMFEISSAGSGSKFAMYHDGTMAPGQSDRNWRAETRKHRLPSEMLQHEKDEREIREYGR